MNTEEFLNVATAKVGPTMAADLLKMANSVGLLNLLIEKGIITQDEFEAHLQKQLDKFARGLDELQKLSSNS